MPKLPLHAAPLGSLTAPPEAPPPVAFETIAPAGPWADPTGLPLQGSLHAGTYAEVTQRLNSLPALPTALILLFTRGSGMEPFLAGLKPELRGLPLAGGAVARAELDGAGQTRPPAADLVALALEGAEWSATTVRYHRATGIHLSPQGADPRAFTRIDGPEGEVDALGFFEKQFARLKLPDAPWDRCALLDRSGRLLHLSRDGETVRLGADLPADRQVELALFDQAEGDARMQAAVKPGTLIFGCAGLHGLLQPARPWADEASVAYMYGEAVTTGHGATFANLSMSLLVPN